MPFRSPYYELPGLQPDSNGVLGRVLKEAELFPQTTRASLAAPVSLSTLGAVATLASITTPIPAHMQVVIHGTFHFVGAALTRGEGRLRVSVGGVTTTQDDSAHAACDAGFDMSVCQTWNPRSTGGIYTYEIVAQNLSGGAVVASTGTSITVTVV